MSLVYGKSGTVFTGRLIKDPERKTSNSGSIYCQLSLSVTTGERQDGQQYAPSIIVSTNAPGSCESACMRLKKGDVVTITTQTIKSREGQDGKKWYNAMADSICFNADVIERIMMSAGQAAVDALDPGKAPAVIDGDDGLLPF